LAIVGFMFITNVGGIMCYVISVAMVLGTLMETVCVDAVMFRNADREIRGVINGTGQALGFTGQFVFSLLGGWLFDTWGAKAPFVIVGACDFVMCVLTFIFGRMGVIHDDISQRLDEARLRREHKAAKAKEDASGITQIQ